MKENSFYKGIVDGLSLYSGFLTWTVEKILENVVIDK
jgi:hypothetical protein